MSNRISTPLEAAAPVRIPTHRSAVTIALGYALVGAVWILGSGWLLDHLAPGRVHGMLEALKGCLFVAITAVLLGLALDRYFGLIGRTVQLLGESEQRWRAAEFTQRKWANAFEHCAHGIALGDPETNNVLACNPTLARMLGRTVAEVVGARIVSLYVPEDHPQLKSWIAEADRLGHARYESRMLRADGSTFAVQMDVVTVRDSQGKPLYRVATAQDITERRRLEEERASALVRYQTLFNSFPLAITVADRQGRIVETNQLAEKILGVSAEELNQRSIQGPQWNIVRPDGSPMPPEEFASVRALQEGRLVQDVELGIVRSPEAITWLNVTAVPLSLPDRSVVVAYSDISARKRAEQALRESQQMLETVVRHLPTHVILIRGSDLRIQLANPAYQAISPGRVILGRTLDEIWAETGQDFAALCRRVLETGEPHQVEDQMNLIRAPGGQLEPRYFSWSLHRVRLPGEEGWGILNLSMETTARRKAEIALRASEERLRLALDAVHMGTFDWDLVQQRITWTHWHERLWGFQPGEFDGSYQGFVSRVHPDDVAGLNADVQRCMAQREPFDHEFRVVWPDDSVHWVVGKGQFEYDAAGQAVRMRGTVLEFTDRKLAEEALARNQAVLKAALESMTDAVFISDLEGRFVEFNEAFATFHKFKNKEACAKTLAEYPEFLDVFLPSGELAPLTEWAVPRALRGETATNAEYSLRRKDTAQSWVGSYSFGPIRNKDGAIVGSVVAGRDITDLKRAEETLRQRNEELVRFTYTVSHDLKSPLVTITTFLGYLERDLSRGDPARIASDMNYIRRAAEKMLEMLDDLLELSRIGRKQNPPEEVSLQSLAQEAQDLVAGQIAERHVQVRVTKTPVLLRGDRPRLIEVFQNLLDNAVKFMGDQPTPLVEIGAEPANREIVLFVRDNGIGVDPRHKDKLFGLFEKLHPGSPGTGIGLALVKRIVETHGGRIWVESAGPGHGATFRFTLRETKRL